MGKRLELAELHNRHPGVPSRVSGYYTVAAAICLQRHHISPCSIGVAFEEDVDPYDTEWGVPTMAEQRSFANSEDATCYGAYTLALAAALAHLGQKAIGRCETKAGADWYLVPDNALPADDGEWYYDRDDISRLEVSGVDRDDDAKMRARLGKKVAQVRAGRSCRPGYAAIVGFAGARVHFAKVQE